jgi:hypothetical protein
MLSPTASAFSSVGARAQQFVEALKSVPADVAHRVAREHLPRLLEATNLLQTDDQSILHLLELAQYAGNEFSQFVRSCVNHRNAQVRRAALRGLSGCVAEVQTALRDTEKSVRSAALEALFRRVTPNLLTNVSLLTDAFNTVCDLHPSYFSKELSDAIWTAAAENAESVVRAYASVAAKLKTQNASSTTQNRPSDSMYDRLSVSDAHLIKIASSDPQRAQVLLDLMLRSERHTRTLTCIFACAVDEPKFIEAFPEIVTISISDFRVLLLGIQRAVRFDPRAPSVTKFFLKRIMAFLNADVQMCLETLALLPQARRGIFNLIVSMEDHFREINICGASEFGVWIEAISHAIPIVARLMESVGGDAKDVYRISYLSRYVPLLDHIARNDDKVFSAETTNHALLGLKSMMEFAPSSTFKESVLSLLKEKEV